MTAASSSAWAGQQGRQVGDVRRLKSLPEGGLGHRREELRTEHIGKEVVHPVHRVAHRHGGEGVAVVATAHGQEAVLARSAVAHPALQGHLDGDLDGHRAGVAEEHASQRGRRQRDQPPCQSDHGRVRQAAEHDVAHGRGLSVQRLVEHRVAVAVDGRPPRRHAVDHLAAVGELQPGPVRGDDGIRRHLRRHAGIRVPHVSGVAVDQRGDLRRRQPSRHAGHTGRWIRTYPLHRDVTALGGEDSNPQ